MLIKKLLSHHSFLSLRVMMINVMGLLSSSLIFSSVTYAQTSLDQTQTLQIHTHFRTFVGSPTWLLVVRDVDTGLVSPYIFDISNNDNFWVAFTYGHNYKIMASTLTFGRYAVIHNFCSLENGILSGTSMYMTLTGDLSPDRRKSKCYVMKYSDTQFTIANPDLQQ